MSSSPKFISLAQRIIIELLNQRIETRWEIIVIIFLRFPKKNILFCFNNDFLMGKKILLKPSSEEVCALKHFVRWKLELLLWNVVCLFSNKLLKVEHFSPL